MGGWGLKGGKAATCLSAASSLLVADGICICTTHPRAQGAAPGGGQRIAAVADLGGSIITGADGNPLAVLAAQLGAPLHDIAGDDAPLFLADGSEVDARLDVEVGGLGGACWAVCCAVCAVLEALSLLPTSPPLITHA